DVNAQSSENFRVMIKKLDLQTKKDVAKKITNLLTSSFYEKSRISAMRILKMIAESELPEKLNYHQALEAGTLSEEQKAKLKKLYVDKNAQLGPQEIERALMDDLSQEMYEKGQFGVPPTGPGGGLLYLFIFF